MTARYAIKTDARAEASELFGEDFAECVLGRFDAKDIFAPVCGDPSTGATWLDASRARHVWPDMLEELR